MNMLIKRLILKNFGKENICQTVEFNEATNFATDEHLFEAIRSFVDKKFLNEEVTKPKYRGNDSFAVLVVEIDGREFQVKNKFGRNRATTVNGEPENAFYAKYFPCNPISESYYTSRSNFSNLIMEQFFGHQLETEKQLVSVHDRVNTVRRDVLGTFTRQERDDIKANIEHDLPVHKEIEKCNWKWLLSTQNPASNVDCCQKILELEPANPPEPIDFVNTAVNVSMASLQFNVSDDNRKKCERTIEAIEKELEVYPLDGGILFSSTWEEIQIETVKSTKLLEFAKRQLNIFQADDVIIRKCKDEFSSAEAWENEKEIIRRKRIEERKFFDELKDDSAVYKTDLEAIRKKIDEHSQRIETLQHALDEVDVADLIALTYSDFQSNIWETILYAMDEFCEVLCETLNDPALDIADIKNYIEGMFHTTINYPEMEQPRFLFNHVTCRNHFMSNMLQTYLAPLSRVMFFPKSESAIDLLERIMDEPIGRGVETPFIYAVGETIERQPAPPAGSQFQHLSTIPKEFTTDSRMMENLLSNFKITHQQLYFDGNANLLNLKKKSINYVNKEKTLATETKNLFQLLRTIQNLYQRIGQVLFEFDVNLQAFLQRSETLVAKLNEYYRIESELRTELLHLQLASFDDMNMNLALQETIRFMYESKSRLTVFDKMLLVQYDDEVDNARYAEALSQLTEDVTELSVVVGEENVSDALRTYRPRYQDAIKKIRDYVGGIHKRQLKIKNDLREVHMNWVRACNDFSIEPINDVVRKKLATISGINYRRYGSECKKYSRRLAIPLNFRERNNLSYQEIITEVDMHLATLRYPHGHSKKVAQVGKYFESFGQYERMTENVISAAKNVIFSYGESTNVALDALCTKMTVALAQIKNDANYSVHCELIRAEFNSVEWEKSTIVPKRIAPKVRFYAKHGLEPVDELNGLISILLYVYYVQRYTIQPILLARILEQFDEETIINVYNVLKMDMANRFSMILINRAIKDKYGLDAIGTNQRCPPNNVDDHRRIRGKRRSTRGRGSMSGSGRKRGRMDASRTLEVIQEETEDGLRAEIDSFDLGAVAGDQCAQD